MIHPGLLLLICFCCIEGLLVKVGHVGNVGILNEESILLMAKEQLERDGILDSKLQIEIKSVNGCGQFIGVDAAAEMYYKQNVTAFIGPSCADEMDAVAKLAGVWNVPVVGYMSSAGYFVNKTVYSTLARMSTTTANGLADALHAILRHFTLTTIAIAHSTDDDILKRVEHISELLLNSNINLVTKVSFPMDATAEDIIASGKLKLIQNSARIVIVMFGSALRDSRPIMKAFRQVGMTTDQYLFILPWLYHDWGIQRPWLDDNKTEVVEIKADFNEAILLDNDVNVDAGNEAFVKRVSKEAGLSDAKIAVTRIHNYLALYDSLSLYVHALKNAINKTGDESIYRDGKYLWNQMRLMNLDGASGPVATDALAERIPHFAAYYVHPDDLEQIMITNIKPIMEENCDGMINGTGCYYMTLENINEKIWVRALEGKQKPKCGFDGLACDIRPYIAGGGGALVVLILIVLVWAYRRYRARRLLASMPWQIPLDKVRLIDDSRLNKTISSLKSSHSVFSAASQFIADRSCALFGNNYAKVQRFKQTKALSFDDDILTLLLSMKQLSHDNLNPFLGICCNNSKNEMMVLWKHCSRGTLYDYLHNDNMVMDNNFKKSFIRDITQGVEYLHASPVGYHGSLSPQKCLIDSNFVVKLGGFALQDPIQEWKDGGAISAREQNKEESKNIELLYVAPEDLRVEQVHKKKHTKTTNLSAFKTSRQIADMYAFGITLYETLFRQQPYAELEEEVEAIVKEIREYQPSRAVQPRRPMITQEMAKDIHADVILLMRSCWAETVDARPTIKRAKRIIGDLMFTKGGLIDQMMKMQEQYANNLEKLVKDRTAMFEEAQLRADRLLLQILPKDIAMELKMGRAVPPRSFDSATVLFTDIVGFTTICSSCSPVEIVSFLNGLFSGYDEIINESDAFKVETIGDAYLVVSGVPTENESRHVKIIAEIAIKMREFLSKYELPHKPSGHLQARWGMHTGPVAAGVVGLTAPRYCLFGDTVNMASRMESTGLPGSIQMSESSHSLIHAIYQKKFVCEPRGTIEVKGKGQCSTYWLKEMTK